MYYPESQITTDLFSNGELIYKSTGKIYIGPYYKISSGLLFSGKNPKSQSPQELLSSNMNNNVSQKVESINNHNYSILSNNKTNETELPYFLQPPPTEEEYKRGEFIRYFCKKSNEIIYLEIDKTTFNRLKSKDESIYWKLYIPFQIVWKLTGENAEKQNKYTVETITIKEKLYNFPQYLKEDYKKYVVV